MSNEHEGGGRWGLTSEPTAQGEEQGWANRPHEDLVRAFRGLIRREREAIQKEGRKTSSFTPAIIISNALGEQSSHHMSSDPLDKQRAAFFWEIEKAWDVIAYEHFRWEQTGEPALKRHFAGLLLSDTYKRAKDRQEPRPELIKLDPQQVKILDALAEATDIPHERGQAEIEIPEHLRRYEERLRAENERRRQQ